MVYIFTASPPVVEHFRPTVTDVGLLFESIIMYNTHLKITRSTLPKLWAQAFVLSAMLLWPVFGQSRSAQAGNAQMTMRTRDNFAVVITDAFDEKKYRDYMRENNGDTPHLTIGEMTTEDLKAVDIDVTMPVATLTASLNNISAQREKIGGHHMCRMKDWGVQFTCDVNWEVMDRNTDLLKIVLSKDPLVTVSLKRFDEPVHFLNQLNTLFMEKNGRYKNGYQTERVKFAGYDAILVKGYSTDEAQTQLRDYYYLHNNRLYGVYFRLSPQERWEEGKLIIKEMKENFSQIE